MLLLRMFTWMNVATAETVSGCCAPSKEKISSADLLPFADFVRMNQGAVDDPDSDDALMARFCQGDEQAFAALYDRHARQLEIFLRRFVADRALAEDLLQTTFLSFVRARGRYVPTAGVRAWLFTIAANAARDALRRRGSRREDSLGDDAADMGVGGAEESAERDPQMSQAIETALRQLPPDQREAVLLHKMHGLSFPEVAAAQGTTVGAAKLRAHRGYQRLRLLLAPWENA